jgi:branched-chain amino acid transport system permease protein
MAILWQSLVSGLLIGGIYALIGIGLTLIFGVMRVINFAQGDFLMLGMYASLYLIGGLGLMSALGPYWAGIDPFASVLICMPLLFAFGAFLQWSLIQRVLDALPQNQILLTIGVGLVLSNTAMLLFTSDYQLLSTSYSSSSVHIAGISVSAPLAGSFLVTALLTALLYWFLLRTEAGVAVRATAQDRDAAQLMGIDVRRSSMLAMGIGAALAGAAGALIAPTYYIYPQVGGAFTLKAFVVVVLGGMGSVIGATLGGLLIGVAESLAGAFVGSGFKDLFVFVLFLLVLLLKPSGLLGKSRV